VAGVGEELMFDIRNSRDFLEKLFQDYEDLSNEPDSARLAINAAITAYHLAEWVWGDWLKTDFETWRRLSIRDEVSFKAWIDKNCFYFPVMQRITNGSKHFIKKEAENTLKSGGWGEGAYGVGPYGKGSLQVDVGDDGDPYWIEASVLIEDVVIFWKDFFLECSPYKDNMPQHGHLTEFKD
jgi:hypothetical protein